MVWGIIALSIFCLYLLLQLQTEKRRLSEPDIRYVDISGVTSNPPENFVETWQGRTLNIKVNDKHCVIIPHLPAPESLHYIEAISREYAIINTAIDTMKHVGMEGLQRQAILHFSYKRLVLFIYKLSKSFGKIGYKKELYKKAKHDVIWLMEVTENILDYWKLIKKKIIFQTKGQTLRETAGYHTTWTDYKLDKQGKRLAEPRYELR
jgi:hypothetical protein